MTSPPRIARPRVTAALVAALTPGTVLVLDGLPRSGRTTAVQDAVDRLPGPVRWIGATGGSSPDGPAPRTVVVDDAHRLPAEVTARLVRRAVEHDDVRLVLLGRGPVRLNRTALRAEGRLAEPPASLLAWRSHEVDALLLATGVTLSPALVERLTRGSGGWTALIMAAVSGLAEEHAPERAVDRTLAEARRSGRTLLAGQLDSLPRSFVQSLADVVGGAECPREFADVGVRTGLLAVRNGRVVLAPEVEPALRPGGGEAGRARWRAAAVRAVREGRWADSLLAADHLDSGDGARRAVDVGVSDGLDRPLSPDQAVRLLGLTTDLATDSPWAALALARASVVDGRPALAARRYDALIAAGPPEEVRRRAHVDRSLVDALNGSVDPAGPSWLVHLQSVLSGHGVPHQTGPRDPEDGYGRLVGQLAHLLVHGRRAPAARTAVGLPAWLAGLVTLLDAAGSAVEGAGPPVTVLHGLADRFTRGGQPWAARAAYAVAELVDGTAAPSGWWAVSCADRQDRWGELLARLVDGMTWHRLGNADAAMGELRASAVLADALHAPVLAVWARALSAQWCCDPLVDRAALLDEAERLGLPGVVRVLGPVGAAPLPPSLPGTDVPIHLRCLGTPALEVGGVPLPRGALKPRHRALLHLLGSRCDERIHREELVEALWPDTPYQAGLRGLQVAVSAVRQVLARSGQPDALQRDGESYQLVAGPGVRVDVGELLSATQRGLRAAREGAVAAAESALQEALELYRGDLLIGEQAAEWLLQRRDHLRTRALAAARALSSLRLQAGDGAGSADAAERGLVIDAYDDELWRTLLRAHRAAGNEAAARRVDERYRQVLAELEVEAPTAVNAAGRR